MTNSTHVGGGPFYCSDCGAWVEVDGHLEAPPDSVDESEELQDLQDPDAWDWEEAVELDPVPGGVGVRLCVNFTHGEQIQLALMAAERDERLTEFVRKAAIVRARKINAALSD